MKHFYRALLVFGVLSVASAFAWIGPYLKGTSGIQAALEPIFGRIVAAAYGGGLLWFAWCIRHRPALASRLFAPALWLAWIYFVVGGTVAAASQYPKGKLSDELILGGIVAIVSLPVALYWNRRIRAEFDVIDQENG